MSHKEQRVKRQTFVREMLEEFEASEILQEMRNQLMYSKDRGKFFMLERLDREMLYTMQNEGYKIYKNLSLFQGEQVDEFVCQLFPYHNDQQTVIC